MALINVMEHVVDDIVRRRMTNSDCCKCENCVDEIKCLALNKLPAKYVSTAKGELFSKVDSELIAQSQMDVNVAVLSAIEFVRTHPRHGTSPPQ